MFDEAFIREMSPIDAYNYGRQKALEECKDREEKVIDEFFDMLNNPWTIDSILSTDDKYHLIAIFKRISKQLKEERNYGK